MCSAFVSSRAVECTYVRSSASARSSAAQSPLRIASKRRSSALSTSAATPVVSVATGGVMTLSFSNSSRDGARPRAGAARRDHVLAEHLDRLQRALVRNGLRLHDQNDLVDARFLVEPHALDAAVRIAGDDDAALAERVGIHLTEGRPRRARAAVERDPDLRGLLLVRLVGLPQPPAEVGLQVIRHAAPGFQQLLVGVDTVADVRLVGAEERLERERGERPRLLVVLAAEGVDAVAPVLVDDGAHRGRL